MPILSFILYFFRLGTLGFGGPIALAGHMHDDVVKQRGWITPQDYKEGLALAQLAPGPLAAQLAMYLGWVRGGILGATLVAVAFIGPSFLMVLVLSTLYVRYGGLPWMQAVFYGVGAAVIAIIARSAVRLTKTTLGKDRLLWILFAISAAVTAWTESEIVWVFLASGIAALIVRHPPRNSARALALAPLSIPAAVGLGTLATLFWYFAAAGLFVFGSGLAIVPFLHGGVVLKYHWLTERQFLDAVAVSIITPGPVVITVAFIGYLVDGPLGATAAALGVFLPVYVITVLGAAYFRRIAGNVRVKAFVDGVTAAATGAIGGAVFVLGRRALIDLPAVLFALGALGLLSMRRRIPEPLVILGAGLLGLGLKGSAPAPDPTAPSQPGVCSLAGPAVIVHWSGAIPEAPTTGAPLRLVSDIALPGGAFRFDYQSLEPSDRLFMSHMGAGQIVVFDVGQERVLANLNGFSSVTGVLAVPSEHRVYASAAGEHAVVVVNDSTFETVARIPGPRFPDGLAYAPEQRRVFVSDESGGQDFVIDAEHNAVVTRVALGGEAGNTQYDAGSHCVIVAVQTANQLAVIDPASATIVRRITLAPAIGYPHGFFIDAAHRVAFVTGEESATLGVLDLETLQLRQVLRVGRGPDVLAFDSTLGRLYVAAESGIVAVFEARDRSLTQLGWYRASRAHTVAVDPRTHRVYLPLADIDGRPVLRVLEPSDR